MRVLPVPDFCERGASLCQRRTNLWVSKLGLDSRFAEDPLTNYYFYSGVCNLEYEACKQNKPLYMVSQGECPPKNGCKSKQAEIES